MIVEYPTYHRALDALFAEGVNIVYLDWQGDGPNLDLLASQLQGIQRPGLAYLMPTFHNPTGRVLTRDDRWRLGSLLHQRQILTLEDDSYGLLRFEGEPVQMLFEPSARTMVFSTSFSATIAPGLRVGVFVLPDALARELARRGERHLHHAAAACASDVFELPAPRTVRAAPRAAEIGSSSSGCDARRPRAPCRRRRRRRGRRVGSTSCSSYRPEPTRRRCSREPRALKHERAIDVHGRPNAVRLNFAEVEIDEIEPGIERLAASLKPSLI